MKMWFKHVKTMSSAPSPRKITIFIYRWYVYQSQSWVVYGFVLGPSRTSRRVLCFAFLLGSARLCVFFSTPVTRIDGLGEGWGWGWGGVRGVWVGGVGGGSGGGGGWGGGGLIAFCRLLPVASSFRHAPDVTLYRSSLAILDTLMMLRSIDLLLQSSTRS